MHLLHSACYQGCLENQNSLAMKSGLDFDLTYMNMMVLSHKETIGLFEMEMANGKDVEVKEFAVGKIVTLKHHLEKAVAVKDALKINHGL